MLLIQACEPLDEVYEELDKTVPSGVVKVLSHELNNTFSSDDEAKNTIPGILNDEFPQLGDGSAVTVSYNLQSSAIEPVAPYTSATDYILGKDDYSFISSRAGQVGYINDIDHIADILAENISDPANGQVVAVTYDYSPVSYDKAGVILLKEDFETADDLSAYQAVNQQGDNEWEIYSSSSGYKAARMSGFADGNVPNEDWLILPAVDLSGFDQAILNVSQVIHFLGDAVIGNEIAIKISTDYDGSNIASATWTNLTFDQWPEGNSYDIVDGEASLAAWGDEEVHLAFYYKSTTDFAPQWRIDEISVAEGEVVKTEKRNNFYEYSGSEWVLSEDVYLLNPADYDAMGAPGQYDNFSSSVSATNYLPQFLNQKYPYAQEEDQIVVIYKYFSSSAGATQYRGNIYTFQNSEWVGFKPSLQFVKEEGVWVPDNTIAYALTADDYIAIADAYESINAAGSASVRTYKNFDVSLWPEAQIHEAVIARMTEVFPVKEGQKYLVTYATYSGSTGEATVKIIGSNGGYILFEE